MANNERLTIKAAVTPVLDKKATQQVVKEATELQRKISSVKIDFRELAKQSSLNVRQINELSKSAKLFSERLSSGAKKAFDNLGDLGDQLKEAIEQAEVLNTEFSKADSKSSKDEINKLRQAQADHILKLTKEIDHARDSMKKYSVEHKKTLLAQQRYHSKLESFGKFTGRDAAKQSFSGVGSILRGDAKSGVSDILKSIGKGIAGSKSRALTERAAAGGKDGEEAVLQMKMLAKSLVMLGGAAAALGVLVKLIADASAHQAKLNKVLLEGTGTANDFATGAKVYTNSINAIRNAAIDSSGSLLKFGMNSEQALQSVNAFVKESSGSITKFKYDLIKLGDGDINKGMGNFAKMSLAYGKALGMESDQVGQMMGQFVGEIGYSAQNVQSLFGSIVQAAATSNMPVHKFMDIFRQTTPSLELFTNRIEELAGVMKMLSKNMSPSQVKSFMNAWGGSLRYSSFQSRLKKTLVAGVDETNAVLGKDFSKKAEMISAQLGGDLGAEFQAAFSKGDKKAVNAVIAKAQSRNVDPSIIGNMSSLMRDETNRRTGGALGTASAMKGAGMMSQIHSFELEKERLLKERGGTTEGIEEAVMENLNYSQEQIEAMNNFRETVSNTMSQLSTYGATTSRSTNKALEQILSARKKASGDNSAVTREDMAKASEDDVMMAVEKSLEDNKPFKLEDLAAQQISATTSLGTKIDNVINFWLEKIYQILQPVVDYISDIYTWLIGGDKRDAIAKAGNWQKSLEGTGHSDSFKKTLNDTTDSIINDINSGGSGAKGAASSLNYLSGSLSKNKDAIAEYFTRASVQSGTIAGGSIAESRAGNRMREAIDSGDLEKVFGLMTELKGDSTNNIQELSKVLVSLGGSKEYATVGPQKTESKQVRRASDLDEVKDTYDVESLGAMTEETKKEIYNPENPQMSLIADHTEKSNEYGAEFISEAKKQNDLLANGVAIDLTDGSKKDMTSSSLEAFRGALTEFAVHNVNMSTNSDYARNFRSQSLDISPYTTPTDETIIGNRHSGGPINETGNYRMMQGEYVLTQRAASQLNNNESGSGNKTIHAEVHLHGTNITPDQGQRMVESALGNIMRRQ